MILRRPEYFTSPGFWAEEGTLYFASAWVQSPWQALLARPTAYLALWANVSVIVAARLLPLRDAPLVTTLMGLVAQAAPLAVIAFGLAPEWQGTARKSLGMAIVLFASLTGEVWLNTINSQFHLGLAAALLLLEPADLEAGRLVAYALFLAIAGLTGVVAASLAPLFLLRAWRARTLPTVTLASVAGVCAVLQAAAVYSAGPLAPGRRAGLGLETAGLIVWMKTLVLPVLGVDAAHAIVRAAANLVGTDWEGPSAVVLGITLVLLAGVILATLLWPLSPRVRLALGGSYVILATAAILGGIGDRRMFLRHADNSSRYFYAPGALVLFLLLANARPPDRRPATIRAAVCAALLAIGLALGMVRYRDSLRWQPWWPRWRDEVTAWERDPSRPLAIWPPPKWTVSLPTRGADRPPKRTRSRGATRMGPFRSTRRARRGDPRVLEDRSSLVVCARPR